MLRQLDSGLFNILSIVTELSQFWLSEGKTKNYFFSGFRVLLKQNKMS